MMDIVERLRNGITDGTDLRWTVTQSHLEAADEIERIRKENEELKAALREDAKRMKADRDAIDSLRLSLSEARATGRREGMEEAAGVLETCLITVPLTPGTADGVSITKRQGASAIRAAMEKEE